MDKKTVTGLILIGLVLFGFTMYNSKQASLYNAEKAKQDSIALAKERLNMPIVPLEHQHSQNGMADGQAVDMEAVAKAQDSVRNAFYGNHLYEASRGEEKTYTLENDLMTLSVSNRGAMVTGVELKKYDKYNGEPVNLIAPGSADFDVNFFIMRNLNQTQINTGDYYFTADKISSSAGQNSLAMRLFVDSLSYVEYIYTMKDGDYMVDFDINFVNMENILSPNQSDMLVSWKSIAPRNEKGFQNENQFSTIAYKYPGKNNIETLKQSTGVREDDVPSKVEWVAFKQQFFSSILIAEGTFDNAYMRYDTFGEDDENLKSFAATIALPYSRLINSYNMKIYYGPNKYSTLKKYDISMQRLVPLGWGIFGWVNRYIVIPVFNFLGKYIDSFGIIILILTIFIKLLIFPFTYKSYMSTSKMRVLKPEIEEINARYPKQEDAMKKQQATMELYRKSGVNPMGGCLPLLIQMPVLIAMFRFFPASIELRGESFLWANDLSAYDSIMELPFKIPFYGDHVSLFALLMAVMMFINSKINFNQQPATAPQMGGMKFMMLYFMPIMMLMWFNNYASGLTYYYSVSTFITIAQMMGFRYLIDDKKIRAQLQENAKKPQKKSKWQQRYADMVKLQQEQQKAQAKKRK